MTEIRQTNKRLRQERQGTLGSEGRDVWKKSDRAQEKKAGVVSLLLKLKLRAYQAVREIKIERDI